MTAASINMCANDAQLQARVLAVAQKELVYNTALQDTAYGKQLRQGMGMINIMPLMWPLAADQESQYQAALEAGRGAPGHDADIIADDAILSAVISFWPKDPEPPDPARNMSDNGVVVAEPVAQPQVQIDIQRVLEIIREENGMVYELAIRRATIEAQGKMIEELTARLGGTVP